MNGIPTTDEFLHAIHQWPAMYWGGGSHPFTSLVAFICGFQFGFQNGREDGVSPAALVPADFHDYVSRRLLDRPSDGGEGWMRMIREKSASEADAFQLFFKLRFEYDSREKVADPPPSVS